MCLAISNFWGAQLKSWAEATTQRNAIKFANDAATLAVLPLDPDRSKARGTSPVGHLNRRVRQGMNSGGEMPGQPKSTCTWVAAPDVILSQVLPLSTMVSELAPKLQPLALSFATMLLSR